MYHSDIPWKDVSVLSALGAVMNTLRTGQRRRILRGHQEGGSEISSKHFPYVWSLFCSFFPRLEGDILEIMSLPSCWPWASLLALPNACFTLTGGVALSLKLPYSPPHYFSSSPQSRRGWKNVLCTYGLDLIAFLAGGKFPDISEIMPYSISWFLATRLFPGYIIALLGSVCIFQEIADFPLVLKW